MGPEGSEVGNHVHVAGTDVGLALFDAMDGITDLVELGLGGCDLLWAACLPDAL
jgi:hypothetical protein